MTASARGPQLPTESGLLLALPQLAAFTGRWRATSLAPGHPPVPVERRFPPHLTLLIPWRDPQDRAARQAVVELAARHPPRQLLFRRAETFDNGRVVWLVPEPASAIADLIEDTLATFPDCRPYGGQHGEVIPHVTVSANADAEVFDQVCTELKRGGPLTANAESITIFARSPDQVWRPHCSIPLTGILP
ncbi:MAG: 2'-5' RNA ligase family protein [Angustibacter sp.]